MRHAMTGLAHLAIGYNLQRVLALGYYFCFVVMTGLAGNSLSPSWMRIYGYLLMTGIAGQPAVDRTRKLFAISDESLLSCLGVTV